jgi:hypothetical protein
MPYYVESRARSAIMPIFEDFSSAVDFAVIANLNLRMNNQVSAPIFVWQENKQKKELVAFLCLDTMCQS